MSLWDFFPPKTAELSGYLLRMLRSLNVEEDKNAFQVAALIRGLRQMGEGGEELWGLIERCIDKVPSERQAIVFDFLELDRGPPFAIRYRIFNARNSSEIHEDAEYHEVGMELRLDQDTKVAVSRLTKETARRPIAAEFAGMHGSEGGGVIRQFFTSASVFGGGLRGAVRAPPRDDAPPRRPLPFKLSADVLGALGGFELEDVAEIDAEVWRSLVWCLENDPGDAGLRMALAGEGGAGVELVPGARDRSDEGQPRRVRRGRRPLLP
jgi:hypothetical protein